jgi:4-amino-4-deoxy-L-arabinose transferase-like glycosyltransferase
MRSASRLLGAALAIGVAVRVAFLVFPATPLRSKAVDSVPDAAEYVQLAENLARHHVFSRDSVPPYRPELFRTPAYPLLVAPLFAAFSSPLLACVLLQLVLSLAAVWACYRLAVETGLERIQASVSALLVAASPNVAFLSTKLITEPLFTVLLLFCLILLNRYRLSRRPVDLIGAGVGTGLMILTRPIATYFPALVALYVLYLKLRDRRVSLWMPLVPLACASIVVMPWVVRNGRATGRYIVSTAAEHNLYLYNAAAIVAADKGVTLVKARDSMFREAQARFASLDSTDEASFWQDLSKVAWQHVAGRPWLALETSAIGFLGSFVLPISVRPLLVHSGAGTNPDYGPNPHVAQEAVRLLARGHVASSVRLVWHERLENVPGFVLGALLAASLFQVLLMASAVVGLLVRRSRGLLWLLLPILYFTLTTGPLGDARFRAPVEPLLAVLAAAGLAALSSRGSMPAAGRK